MAAMYTAAIICYNILIYVGYDDYNNIHKMRNFEIVEKVPEVGGH